MNVAVIGTGHVGLMTCVSMAAVGHRVVGCDADRGKIAQLSAGVLPIFEPGLAELLAEQTAAGRLSFVEETADAVADAEVVFICVGTPPRVDGEADLVAVESAAREVARHVRRSSIIVEKSTVPAGTAGRVRTVVRRELSGRAGEISVVSNPEFLREGRAVEDSLHPERILVGAEEAEAFATMREVYRPFTEAGALLIETDIATAELAKHACNAFLALKISFANALARMCERAGADVVSVTHVMGTDPRIGPDFLRAGLGYGGYCFPKDVQAFERLAARLGYAFPLLGEVARINEEAVEAAVEKLRDALWNLTDKRIALLGLAFKPETDDIRFSPALALAERLLAERASVVGFDPQAMANAKTEVPELELATDAYAACEGADCVVLCTEWPELLTLDLERLRSAVAYPVIFDARNALDADVLAAAGFEVLSMGRPHVAASPTERSAVGASRLERRGA